ncbi:hypothetical protein ACFQ2B_07075 [Streptomyces stramineus]|uniref:Uncharacterized protein n=1 Tax=Streptomyces stramineus TaxID=173861 RepID=A0ABN0ZHG2_9ACTN
MNRAGRVVRLGRDAAELTALADHLTAHGLVLEVVADPQFDTLAKD